MITIFRNKYWKPLVAASAILSASVAHAQSAPRSLNLNDCIRVAVERSTEVLKSDNNVALAGAQVLAAYGQYLPNLVAGGGYNFNHGNNFYGSSGPLLVNDNRSQFNYQLTSSVNIFTGNYNNSVWKASKLNERMAGMTLERAKQQIEIDITQSYLQVLLDKKILALDSANLATSLKREDQLTALTDVGRKAKTDLYQQQARTSSDKLLLINARSKAERDKILLLQKLRIDSTDLYEIADIHIDDDPATMKYGDKDLLVNEALKQRVDLQSAKLFTDYADWNIKKYRSGYLPQVSLLGGVYNNGAYFNSLSINGASSQPVTQEAIPNQLYKNTYGAIGVNATWNIFDKFYTKSNVSMAKILADNARIDLRDTTVSISSSVKLAYTDYVNAVQQMETVEAGYLAAQKAFEAVSARYKEGASDFITTADAQLVLLQAAQNRVQASVNMMLQKRAIDYYTGATGK